MPPAPLETRPALLTYSEGSRGKSKSTTCSTCAESIPREALSVHTSTIGTACIGGARNICSNRCPRYDTLLRLNNRRLPVNHPCQPGITNNCPIRPPCAGLRTIQPSVKLHGISILTVQGDRAAEERSIEQAFGGPCSDLVAGHVPVLSRKEAEDDFGSRLHEIISRCRERVGAGAQP